MEYLKKKTFWYATIALLVFFTDIWIYFYLKNVSRTSTVSAEPAQEIQQSAATSDPLQIIPPTSSPITQTSENDLIEIKRQANQLTQQEIQNLALDAVNPEHHQDLRFKSVYLLAHNKRVPEVLKNFVTTPWPKNLSERDRDFEHILRAQAIEGIENGEVKRVSKQIIQELIQKTDNTFLLDRLNRAKTSLDGTNDSSEVQDNRELEKIIEN